MNLRTVPFDDVRVRKAFTLAIDYEELARKATMGVFETAHGLYPAHFPYAVKNQKFDPDLANRLLDEAGWIRGKDGIRRKNGEPLRVVFVTQAQGPETATLGIVIQSQVRKVGFSLEVLSSEDSAKTKADFKAWNASIGLNGSLSGTADPVQPFLVRWVSGGSANQQGLSDPEIDAIGTKLRSAFDTVQRDALLRRAQEIIVQEKAYVVAATFKRFLVVAGPTCESYTVSNVRRHIRFDSQF
jgi:peptide/nickel transport system substrate-binding protein